jgi:cytochrome c-type biogenesis protein CcmH/NrfG
MNFIEAFGIWFTVVVLAAGVVGIAYFSWQGWKAVNAWRDVAERAQKEKQDFERIVKP